MARFVASNPLFFMTVLGVIFNFILKHRLPDMLLGFFSDLGNLLFTLLQMIYESTFLTSHYIFLKGASFNATALFYLGFSMVGKLKRIAKRGIYILVFILIAKV